MKRLMLALLVAAGPAHAFDWPWESGASSNYSYCRGLVHAGLGALPVENLSRVQLWLAWNEAVMAAFEGGGLDEDQYEAGKARFRSLLDAGDLAALAEVADRECGVAAS